MTYLDNALKALRGIDGTPDSRTAAVNAAVAQANATLELAQATREQTAEFRREIDIISKLWHEQ